MNAMLSREVCGDHALALRALEREALVEVCSLWMDLLAGCWKDVYVDAFVNAAHATYHYY